MTRKRGRPPRHEDDPPKTPVREAVHLGFVPATPVDPQASLEGHTPAEWGVIARDLSRPLVEQLETLAIGFALQSIHAPESKREELTAAARVLAAVHQALRQEDAAALKGWEKAVYSYPLAPDWPSLPPRAGLSRGDAVRRLVEAAREDIARLASGDPPLEPDWLGRDMADAVEVCFPQLATTGDHATRAALICDAYAGLESTRDKADPERLAVAAFVVFGVTRDEAWSWIKSARDKLG